MLRVPNFSSNLIIPINFNVSGTGWQYIVCSWYNFCWWSLCTIVMTCCGPQQLRLHTTNALQFLQSHFTTSFFSILSFFYSTYAGYCGNTNWAEKMSLIFSPYNFWVSRFLKGRNSILFLKLFWPNVRKKKFYWSRIFFLIV